MTLSDKKITQLRDNPVHPLIGHGVYKREDVKEAVDELKKFVKDAIKQRGENIEFYNSDEAKNRITLNDEDRKVLIKCHTSWQNACYEIEKQIDEIMGDL